MPAVPPLRPHPAAVPLPDPEAALSVVLTATTGLDGPATVLLLLDDEHRGLGCVVVLGAGRLRRLVEMVLHLAALEPVVTGLVLASYRGPGAGHEPTAQERRRFPVLRSVLADAGIDLVDWFVAAGLRAASLCELTDGAWRWRADPPGDGTGA